ncbi:hypothetical protein [Streptomyces capitiformicae]|uniref:Uncharacterized protein n=1 Tax=Streptomyces capitiformicae TaxID=2014920 RepID=A0A919GLN6_9ACTN|nr:hypothetical protein [Streptomyces capitiformicae]GHH86813.1 hypothetical protein GCM10017771_25400 [Streptomyces capitiformicae]
MISARQGGEERRDACELGVPADETGELDRYAVSEWGRAVAAQQFEVERGEFERRVVPSSSARVCLACS